LVIEDTNDVFAPNTIQGAIDALSALLVPTVSPYYKLAALPVVEADLFEGKLVYNTTDHTLQVCTTPGEQEVDTLEVTAGATDLTGDITITLNEESIALEVETGAVAVKAATITAGASASGNVTVTLGGVPTVVAVLANDTAAAVAGKIATAYAEDADWTVGDAEAVLTFTAKAKGPKTGTFSIDPASTGVTCTGGVTNSVTGIAEDTAEMVAAKIKDAIETAVTGEVIAAWTVEIDGAELTFTKGVVGIAAAPTAVDTNDTGVTFSAFARTNQGVASVWSAPINAS
jgi:hypothetical protein